jgi:hypothetical protein
MDPDLLQPLIPVGAFIMVAIIVWVASLEKQAKARYRAEVQKELIAKFGSGRELSEFLNSEGSRQFLASLGPKEDNRQDLRHKTIGLITGGLINLSIGGAFLYVATSSRGMSLVGWILTGVGASLLISSGITSYLTKKWGMDQPAGSDLPRSS